MGLRSANRPILDSDGYVTAIVTSAVFGTGVDTRKRARADGDTVEYERFELSLAVEGTAGLIPMTVYTGTALNGILEYSGRGKTRKPVYNRVSTLALNLGFATPDELEGTIPESVTSRIQESLLNLEGEKVRFKLGKVEGKHLMVPIPDTIRRVE